MLKKLLILACYAVLLMALPSCAHREAMPCDEPHLVRTARFLPWDVDTLAVALPGELELDVTDATEEAAGDISPAASSVALLYRVFRRTWGKFDMSRCDLHPSCSRFAVDAVSSLPLWMAVPVVFARLMQNHNDPHMMHEGHSKKHDPVANYSFSKGRYFKADSHQEPAIFWHRHAANVSSGRCFK